MNAPRAGGLRVIRIVLGFLLAVVAVLCVLVAITFVWSLQRVDQINSERTRNILSNCREVNARHDDTVTALDRLLARRILADPGREREFEQGRDSTLLLIDALVPRRDCAALADRQVSTP